MTSEARGLRILLVIASLSGNTRQLGRLIASRLLAAGHTVLWEEADAPGGPDAACAAEVDLVLLGTWTDNAGRTPAEMKRWVAAQAEQRRLLRHVAMFGTGETQWGQEYYCGALERLQRYYQSRYPVLRIEQMPHGLQDTEAVADWTAAVLSHYRRATSAAASCQEAS